MRERPKRLADASLMARVLSAIGQAPAAAVVAERERQRETVARQLRTGFPRVSFYYDARGPRTKRKKHHARRRPRSWRRARVAKLRARKRGRAG